MDIYSLQGERQGGVHNAWATGQTLGIKVCRAQQSLESLRGSAPLFPSQSGNASQYELRELRATHFRGRFLILLGTTRGSGSL